MLNPKTGQVFGWPAGGYPSPQGPFYCGVGSESVYGRNLAEAHMDACIKVRAVGPPVWPEQAVPIWICCPSKMVSVCTPPLRTALGLPQVLLLMSVYLFAPA